MKKKIITHHYHLSIGHLRAHSKSSSILQSTVNFCYNEALGASILPSYKRSFFLPDVSISRYNCIFPCVTDEEQAIVNAITEVLLRIPYCNAGTTK